MTNLCFFATWLLAAGVILGACGQGQLARNAKDSRADVSPQERQCMGRGWKRVELQVSGIEREFLWKAPEGRRPKGAILVLHGGGGHHYQWCNANGPIVGPQVRFSEMAVAEGFAVLLLDSSDRITDREGRLCGKVWDDEVRNRPNLDLPFIGTVIRDYVPRLFPPGGKGVIFITGHSSGGYMTARASTHFDDLVTAFAPVSSGDPYGWHRVCEAGTTLRSAVHGRGFDNETGKHIPEPGACTSETLAHELPWDSTRPDVKPAFRVFRHHEDGINDRSCNEKISRLLRRNGYHGQPDFVLYGGRRNLAHHLWLDDYNRPILDFFNAQIPSASK